MRVAIMRMACAVGALALAGCSTSQAPVDFPTLRKTWKPNQSLACPADYCRAETPDFISPPLDLPAAALLRRARETLLEEPRTELLADYPDRRQFVLVQHTEIVGWPDSVFVEIVPLGEARSALAIYSRSNYGIGDRGVNQARVERWLARVVARSGAGG